MEPRTRTRTRARVGNNFGERPGSVGRVKNFLEKQEETVKK